MTPAYCKVHFWCVGCTLILSFVFIVGHDWYIRLNDTYVLSQDHSREGVVLERYSRDISSDILVPGPCRVTNIEGYQEIGQYIAAKSASEYVLGSPEGKIQIFPDHSDWLAAVRQMDPAFVGDLKTPYVFRDPARLYLSLFCGVLMILWFGIFVHALRKRKAEGQLPIS